MPLAETGVNGERSPLRGGIWLRRRLALRRRTVHLTANTGVKGVSLTAS